MNYIVLDFEFNQAFDFKNNCPAEPIPECRFEIIQIGAVKLDNNFEVVDTLNTLIKPQLYQKIHPYVKKITGITEETLANSSDFKFEIKNFFDFIGTDEKLFCVWGKSDIRALYRNLVYHKIITPPILIKYIDIQELATSYLKYSRGGTIGLKNAVEALNITIEKENFHDALYDAMYTKKVFDKVKPDILPIKIFNSSHIITKKSMSE